MQGQARRRGVQASGASWPGRARGAAEGRGRRAPGSSARARRQAGVLRSCMHAWGSKVEGGERVDMPAADQQLPLLGDASGQARVALLQRVFALLQEPPWGGVGAGGGRRRVVLVCVWMDLGRGAI